ncbi:hypothetical protein V8F20_006278 [Naviculisporaceae sp. PSN 640]
MSDNIAPNTSNAMIDAVLASLPRVDSDNDVEMTCTTNAVPATPAGDADLEPGQIPPWEDKMDSESTTQAAKPLGAKPTSSPAGLPPKPVDLKSSLSRADLAAVRQQPSANSGRSMSTALSVSSTPRNDRVRPLPQSTPKQQAQRVASGPPSFNGSPKSIPGPTFGWATALPVRPSVSAARSPSGPSKPDFSEQWKRLGHKVLTAVPDRRGGLGGGSNQSSRPSSAAANLPALPDRSGGLTGGPSISSQPPLTVSPAPPATQLLSYECQRRGFNPEWSFRQTNVGRFVCNVKLGNTLVQGNTSHSTEYLAKMSTAKEALKVARQLPRRVYFFTGDNSPCNENRPVVKQEYGFGMTTLPPRPGIGAAPAAVNNEEDVIMRDSVTEESRRSANTTVARAQTQAINQALNWIRGPQTASRRSGTQDSQRMVVNAGNDRPSTATQAVILTDDISNDDVLLAAQIRRSMAENSNPEVSKAFLDGLALGSRLGALGATLDRVPRDRRSSRSRSPTAGRRDDRHRVRSPPAPRIRLTPPPQYYSYPGRPSSDRYRPARPAGGQKEAGTERTQENLVPRSANTASAEKRGANDEAWVHDLYYRHNRIKVEED